jgi:hypothetical protein
MCGRLPACQKWRAGDCCALDLTPGRPSNETVLACRFLRLNFRFITREIRADEIAASLRPGAVQMNFPRRPLGAGLVL